MIEECSKDLKNDSIRDAALYNTKTLIIIHKKKSPKLGDFFYLYF